MFRSRPPRRQLGATRPLRFEACEPRLVLDGQGFELTGLFFDVASLQPTDGGLVLTAAPTGPAVEEIPASGNAFRVPSQADSVFSWDFNDVDVWFGGGSTFVNSRFTIGLTGVDHDGQVASSEGDDTMFPPDAIAEAFRGTSFNISLNGNTNTGSQSNVVTPGAAISFANDEIDIWNHATGYLAGFSPPTRLGRLPALFETGLPHVTGLPFETGLAEEPNENTEGFAKDAASAFDTTFDTAVVPLASLLADVPNTDRVADAAPVRLASANPSTATGRLLLLAGQAVERPSEPTLPLPVNPVGLARAWAFDVAALDAALAEQPARRVGASGADAQAETPAEPLRSTSAVAPGWQAASLNALILSRPPASSQIPVPKSGSLAPDTAAEASASNALELAFADSSSAVGLPPTEWSPSSGWSAPAAGLAVSTIAVLAIERTLLATGDEPKASRKPSAVAWPQIGRWRTRHR